MNRERRSETPLGGRPTRVGAGLIVLLLSASGPLGAQEPARGNTIRGTVKDAQGAALPGVTLTATSTDNAPPRVVVTNEEGVYEFVSLPDGRTFRIQAELSAFVDFVRSGIKIDPNAPVTIDIVLQLGLSETVQVLGEDVTRSRNSIEKVQDVPLSISVVSGRELERLEATGIAAITQRVANVTWNLGNQRTSSLSIRGVGKQGQTEAQDPSVGVIVDGVNYAYNALTSSFDFTDVDTVEVTRGPQGTLAGKNTSLGVINVITRRPVFIPSADATITFGQHGDLLVRAAAGGPISSKYAWRAAFSATKAAGDQTNLYNEDITYTNQDRLTGRVQLLAVFTPNISTRVQADFTPRGSETTNGRTVRTPYRREFYTDGTPVPRSTDAETRLARRWFTQQGTYAYANYLNYDKPDTVNNDFARGLVTGNNGASVELNWVQGNSTITSITAYKDYHFDAVNDEGTPFDVQRNSGGFWNDYQQASQEVRLASRLGTLANYQVGVFYIDVFNSADYRKEWGNDAGAWYANPAQYTRLDADSNGRYLMQNSLDRLKMSFNSPAGIQKINNKSAAIFGQANWQLGENLVLTTGLRRTREDRQTRASTFIQDSGMAPELNPVAVNGMPLGGFASNGSGNLTANTAEQLQLADVVAFKYFGLGSTGTAGGAYNSLTAAQKQQVADAKSIRQAQIGVVFPWRDAEPFQRWQTSAVVSPLYRINEDLNVYATWQYGEKAGISQFTNGVSNLTPGEISRSYEAGVKSVLFRHRLLFNADVFWSNIGNYQQGVRVLDVYTTTNNNDGLLYYTSATGAVPKVRTQGVEVDGVLAAITNATVRFAVAYTDGYYASFPNSALPSEINPAGQGPYIDVSGTQLPGSYKWSFNLGPECRIPAFGDKEVHFSANVAYNSTFNNDSAGSIDAWIPGKTLVDFSAGFGRRDGKFGVNVLFKNLLDNATRLSGNPATGSYTPAVPRWIGVQFTTRL